MVFVAHKWGQLIILLPIYNTFPPTLSCSKAATNSLMHLLYFQFLSGMQTFGRSKGYVFSEANLDRWMSIIKNNHSVFPVIYGMLNNRQTYQVLLVMYIRLQNNYSLTSIVAPFLPASSNRITKDLTSTSNCNLMLGKPNDMCTNGLPVVQVNTLFVWRAALN